MIVVMEEGATEEEIQHVINKLMDMGFDIHRSTGVRQTVLGAVGAKIDFDTRDIGLIDGVEEAIAGGVLAGFPMVDVKVAIVDGTFHEVDSSELAFKMAGIFALKDAAKKADPVLLEPIMKVEVVTPEEFMGDIIGDLNRRRGMVLGTEDAPAGKIVRAEVPLAEMFGYATAMRSATQGRATYSMEFEKYNETPANVAEAVIKKAS